VDSIAGLGARAIAWARGSTLAFGLLVVSTTVPAQSPAPILRYEVTPFVGFRMGGSFTRIDTGQSVKVDEHGSQALTFDVLANDSTLYELFYGRQSTQLVGAGSTPARLRVEYLHIGGLVPFEGTPRLNPYFGGGLGFTHFSPDPSRGSDDTRFSLSLALGVRVPLNPHFSLRFEGRGYMTLIPANTAIFCRSDQNGGLCAVHLQGAAFFQADLLAGAAFAF
jgi:hypothetical protein